MTDERVWLVGHKGNQHGPFTDAEVRADVAAGKYTADALVWRDGWANWQPIFSVFPLGNTTPPPFPPQRAGGSAVPPIPQAVHAAAPPSNSPVTGKKRRGCFIGCGTLLALVVVIGIISALNSDDTPTRAKTTAGSSAPATAPGTNSTPAGNTSFKIGEAIKLGDFIVTVNRAESSFGNQMFQPTAGQEWINLNVTIENRDNTDVMVSSLGQMFIRDGQGNSYQVTPTEKTMENPAFSLDGTILANSKRTGWVGFAVNRGATGLVFQFNSSMFGMGGNIQVGLGR